jgi:hypothetical protein
MTKPRGLRAGFIKWTPEQDAFLLKHYETGMSVVELIRGTGGHPKDAVYKRAAQLGMRREVRAERPMGPTALRASALAARTDGLSIADLIDSGITSQAAYKCTSSLIGRGMLFRGVLTRKTVRYFTTQAAADRYVSANLPAQLAKRPATKRVVGPWDRDAPMVITPQTKYTYATPPPAQVFKTNTYS